MADPTDDDSSQSLMDRYLDTAKGGLGAVGYTAANAARQAAGLGKQALLGTSADDIPALPAPDDSTAHFLQKAKDAYHAVTNWRPTANIGGESVSGPSISDSASSYLKPAADDIAGSLGQGKDLVSRYLGDNTAAKLAGVYALAANVGGPEAEGAELAARVGKATGRPSAEATLALRNAAGPQSVKSLSQAFDQAISDHLALDPADRKQNSLDMKARLQPYMGNGTLLSKNGKMMKSEAGYGGDSQPIKLPDGRGVETTGLSLHPAYEEDGITTCPNSASCKLACLGKTSGGNFMFGGGGNLDALEGPRLSHFNTTMAMLGDPQAFAVRLNDEIQAAKMKAASNGNKLGVRLNVLSDINPRVHQSIINAHPDVDFYDYTKNASNPVAPNHHYTYSSTGVSNPALGIQNDNQNWSRMRNRLNSGSNVAMSFSVKGKPGDGKLPTLLHDAETGTHYTVVDGDTHDYRPMDTQPPGAPGVIVGLRNKANTTKQATAAQTSNGFFVHHDPSTGPIVTIPPQTRARAAFTNDKAPDLTDQLPGVIP